MEPLIATAVVFYGIYHIIKLISEHFLKRKLINQGNLEQVGVLNTPIQPTEESQRYPSLKWGLVAFMAGLGLIVIEIIGNYTEIQVSYSRNALPYGIELVFISLGFLIYFFLVNRFKKPE